jgi:DNA-binding MarR family transcriptional regulator
MNTNDELISLIFKIGRLMREKTLNGDKHNFSFLQIKVLSFIASAKEPTMKDISDNFRIACPSATAVIDRLVELENIRRIQDISDRRIVRLALTAKGKSTLECGMKDLSNRMEILLSNLNEREKEDLKTILNKITGK